MLLHTSLQTNRYTDTATNQMMTQGTLSVHISLTIEQCGSELSTMMIANSLLTFHRKQFDMSTTITISSLEQESTW